MKLKKHASTSLLALTAVLSIADISAAMTPAELPDGVSMVFAPSDYIQGMSQEVTGLDIALDAAREHPGKAMRLSPTDYLVWNNGIAGLATFTNSANPAIVVNFLGAANFVDISSSGFDIFAFKQLVRQMAEDAQPLNVYADPFAVLRDLGEVEVKKRKRASAHARITWGLPQIERMFQRVIRRARGHRTNPASRQGAALFA